MEVGPSWWNTTGRPPSARKNFRQIVRIPHHREGWPTVATANTQNVTIRGRLSFPCWTYEQAVKQDAKSKFPAKTQDDIRPKFELLLDDAQGSKLVAFVRDTFLPWCEEQGKTKQKSGLTPAQVKKLTKVLDEADWEVEGILGLIKPVSEKTAELAPEAVMTVTVKGYKGSDITKKAVVRSESDLRNPAEDLIIPERGLIMPLADTNLDLYPGSIVASTINLYAFVGANVGITATGDTAVFVADAERFGGGGAQLDEDQIFMDLDD
jgi:hypothetical protein